MFIERANVLMFCVVLSSLTYESVMCKMCCCAVVALYLSLLYIYHIYRIIFIIASLQFSYRFHRR